MAFNEPPHDETQQEITPKSLRECRFYFKYLQEKFSSKIDPFDATLSIEELTEDLNQEIYFLSETSSAGSVNTIIKQLHQAFLRQAQLIERDFHWLMSQQDRFVNWLWCVLKNQDRGRSVDLPDFRGRTEDLIRHLSQDAFRNDKNNVKDRQDDIIEAFQHSELTKEEQESVIRDIVHYSNRKLQDQRLVKAFAKNNYDPEWAWKHVRKKERRLSAVVWQPSSPSEYKAAVIAALDTMQPPEKAELLLGNLSRAWSQKKLRDKDRDKKCVNVYLDASCKQWLDVMAHQDRLRLGEMIDKLITAEAKKRELPHDKA